MTVQRVAQIFGWIFVLVALWGFFVSRGSMEAGPDAPAILGLFPVNLLHNLAHLILGVWGIVAARSFTSYIASAVEVEVDSQGRVRVPRVIQVVDAGTVVNPDRVRAQFEGAAVMGIGLAMTGEISATGGRITQSNFHLFQVPRINDAPVQVDVHIVESDAPPGGVGEPGLPPIVPALTNAIFAATGKRVRELPISKTKLV